MAAYQGIYNTGALSGFIVRVYTGRLSCGCTLNRVLRYILAGTYKISAEVCVLMLN